MKTIVQLVEEQKEYFLGKDTAAKQAVEANIAPVEADASSASRAYVVGEQLFLNDVLYDVTSPISVGYAIVVGTNITAANKLSADIQTLKNKVTDISEVMGKNGAKNKEPFDIDVVKALNTTGTWTGNSYALNGITFAFADDGKVTVSGTASALCSINISGNYDLNGDYIITGCPSGGGISTYSLRIYDSSATVVADDIGEGISFTANNLANCRTNIIVRTNVAISTPIVFAPMIRDSKDPDATYQPYAKTNQELTAENETLTSAFVNNVNENGCKNLIAFDPYTGNTAGTWSGNSYTDRGVTFTVNDDGSILVNGTATVSPVIFTLSVNQTKVLKSGKRYLLSGTPANVNCALKFGTMVDVSNGRSATFIYDGVTNKVQIAIRNNATINNLTYYPMICLPTDYALDSSYVAPSKTNLQLTQDSVSWVDAAHIGAVNWFPNDATTQSISDGTTSFTFTVNSDKSVTVSAPSYPVTLASTISLDLHTFTGNEDFVGKTVKASGGVESRIRLVAYRALTADGSAGSVDIEGDAQIFTWANNGSGTKAKMKIEMMSGKTLSGPVTFKPMITPVSYNGPYVPYAKTNKELTDDVAVKELTFTDFFTLASGYSLSHQVLRKVANGYSIQATILGSLNIGRNAVATMSTVIGTATEETIFGSGRCLDSNSTYHPVSVGMQIKANAELSVYTDTATTNGYCTFSMIIPF